MVSKREERAREKKKEKERMAEEEERKKEEKEAPPTHPFTRDMDKALLLLYNEVQKVTKRAVRKVCPYKDWKKASLFYYILRWQWIFHILRISQWNNFNPDSISYLH